MAGLHLCRHPLALVRLARLRHRDTPPEEFRRLLRQLAALLLVEATADLPLEETAVPTPLAPATGHRLALRLALVPVLRAGLGMVEGILPLLPGAEVWHVGLARNETTLEPISYLDPPPRRADLALVLDPMLATGGSAVAALDRVRDLGVPEARFLGILGTPAGLERMRRQHPGVAVHLCAVDPELDARGFIRPGLGDAGDRQFATTGG